MHVTSKGIPYDLIVILCMKSVYNRVQISHSYQSMYEDAGPGCPYTNAHFHSMVLTIQNIILNGVFLTFYDSLYLHRWKMDGEFVCKYSG